MTQKYPDGERVISPGTVIISAVAESKDIRVTVKPVLAKEAGTAIVYIPFNQLSEKSFELGGSAFAQVTGQLGNNTPDIIDSEYFAKCFETLQQFISKGVVLAGHDISSGGLVTALLEISFAIATSIARSSAFFIRSRRMLFCLFSSCNSLFLAAWSKIFLRSSTALLIAACPSEINFFCSSIFLVISSFVPRDCSKVSRLRNGTFARSLK